MKGIKVTLKEINELWDRFEKNTQTKEDMSIAFEYLLATKLIQENEKIFKLFFLTQTNFDIDEANALISSTKNTYGIGRYLHTLIDDTKKAQVLASSLVDSEEDLIELLTNL